MSPSIEPNGLTLLRNQSEWEEAVRELEATPTGLDSDLFAYWIDLGLGPLSKGEVQLIAKVSLHLEKMNQLPEGPQVGARDLILGALTFASARTNDIRKAKGEPPFDI